MSFGTKAVALIFGITVIAGGLWLLQGGLDFTESAFTLPSRADFIGQTDANSNQSIECKIKQTVGVYDHQGKKIDELQSNQLSGNPILTAELTGRDSNALISHFTSEPKIFCETGTSSFNDITIASSDLTLTVFISDDTGRLVETFQKTQETRTATFDTGADPERTLTAFGVSEQQIADTIADYKTYDSRVDFQISGILNAYYTNYPNAGKMLIPITTEDIKIIYPVTQHIADDPTCPDGKEWDTFELACIDIGDKDTDGDGIYDSADECPTAKETVNGYKDDDGCPDTTPDVEVPTDDPIEPETTCEDLGLIDANNDGICEEPSDPTTPTIPTDPSDAEANLLKGFVDTDITIVFFDNSKESLLASQIQPDGLGTIQLNSVVGGFEGKKNAEIKQIEFRPYFTFETLVDARKVTLLNSDVSVNPTLRINSANQEMASSKLTNWIPTSGKDFLGGKINGVPLGERAITGTEIVAEAVNDGGLTQGQQEIVDLTVELGGTFTVQYDNDVTRTLAIDGNMITFPDWKVSKSTETVASPNCEALGFEVIVINGDIDCQDPKQDPQSETCFTSERPQGFDCSQEWIEQNCINNDPNQCTEPDVSSCEDNNTCKDPTLRECVLGDETVYVPLTEQCPTGTTDENIRDFRIVNGQICIFENGNLVQCVANTQGGGSGSILDDPNFLYIMAIAIVLLGVVAMIAKRRG